MKHLLARVISVLAMLGIVAVGIWLFQPSLYEQALKRVAPSSFLQLTHNLSSDLNPVINDNGQIVYNCSVLADDEICIINADGSEFRQLTQNPVSDYRNPTLNNRGQVALECSRGSEGGRMELCIFDEVSQTLRVIAPNFAASEKAYTLSDADQLIYECELESGGICIATWDANGSPLSREFLVHGQHPVANSLGKIAHYCKRATSDDTDLCITETATKETSNLNLPTLINFHERFDLNNSGQIVFMCRFEDEKQSEICAINMDGTGYKRLTNDLLYNSNPKINDRGQIVFQCQFTDSSVGLNIRESEICVINADGIGYRMISHNLLAGIDPSINNEGMIAYSCIDTEFEICVVKFDDSPFTSITRHGNSTEVVRASSGNRSASICSDPAGAFVNEWGGPGSRGGQFDFAGALIEIYQTLGGIDVDGSGAIYVSDIGNHRVQKFTTDGEFLLAWGDEGSEQGQFGFVLDIAVDDDGSVYVADGGNERVQVFRADGRVETIIENRESVFSPDWRQSGLAVDSEGNLYATNDNQILKFRDTGRLQGSWGTYGSGPGRMLKPSGLAISPDNSVYVSDVYANRIQKYMFDGTYLETWGSFGFGPAQFYNPIDLAFDTSGAIFIADTMNHRIQKFTADGQFLTEWGSHGDGIGQFNLPNGISVDQDNYVYVVDAGNDRVQKFCGGS